MFLIFNITQINNEIQPYNAGGSELQIDEEKLMGLSFRPTNLMFSRPASVLRSNYQINPVRFSATTAKLACNV